MMLTIEDIKKTEAHDAPIAPSLTAVVLDVSPLEPGRDGAKAKFYAILADRTGAISATIYDDRQYPKFMKNCGVVLMNILLKQSYIAITSRSDVAIAQAFEIPEKVKQEAPATFPEYETLSIKSALESPVKSITTVKGKITKILPATTKSVDGIDTAFQEVVLKDTTAKITVSIWENMVDTLTSGQIVKISKCRVRLFQEEKKLTTTKASALEIFSSDPELNNVSDDDDDCEDQGDATGKSMPIGTLKGVFEVDPYLSCPNPKCNNTKLVTIKEDCYIMVCKTCNGKFRGSSANVYMRATFLLETNNQQLKVAMFAPQIIKMWESRGLDTSITFDQKTMLNKVFHLIPITIKYFLYNNTIRQVVCKRNHDN